MRIVLLVTILLSVAQASAQSLPSWQTHRWHVYCDDSQTVEVNASCNDDLPASAASAARAQLEAFGPWAESLGFPGPRVPTDGGGNEPTGYLALLGGDQVELDGDTVCGYYDSDEDGGRLVVGGNTTFQVEGEEDYTGTSAHEAFHAIQGSYPFYDEGTSDHNWIIEGMAQAVEAAWMSRSQDVSQLGDHGAVAYYGSRKYDRPLHQPDPDVNAQLYATSHFWLGVGDLLGSADNVQYLHDVLRRVDADDGGLAGVDAALKTMWPEGLYNLFPEFIVQHANSTSHFEHSGIQVLNVGPETEETQAATVEPIAARLHQVVLSDIEQRTKVTVSIEDRPELHLLVERTRYDADDPGQEGSQRNRSESIVDGPKTLYVRVVNVDSSAAASVRQSYTLTVETEPLASCDDGSAGGLGVAACLDVTGPQFGGIHRFGVEMRRASSLMNLGGSLRVMDTRVNGIGSFRGPPFDEAGLYGGELDIMIQHTFGNEEGRRLINLGINAAEGRVHVILGNGPYGSIIIEGQSLTIEEVDEGRLVRGRFSGTFGGCSEDAREQITCERHTTTNEVIDEHRVQGTFSVRIDEDPD